MSLYSVLLLSVLMLIFSSVKAEEKEGKDVLIAHGLKSVDVMHQGEPVKIMRVQDKSNQIIEFYRKTTRGRIQPMFPFAPHRVDTIGEREVIDYVKALSEGDESIIIVDSRTKAWVKRTGMIPGAVNIPFTHFKPDDAGRFTEILEDQLGVLTGEFFDYSQAKTLVMYCNGVWCGQSPTAIKRLLAMGYPATKIKYYRGGMQSWSSLGLTVVGLEQ